MTIHTTEYAIDVRAVRRTGWYVYLLTRPDSSVFYVGKGCNNRVDHHEQEACKGCDCHKCCVIRKIWREGGAVGKHIIYHTMSEINAYRREASVIASIGLDKLTNVDPGDTWRAGAVQAESRVSFSPIYECPDFDGYVRYEQTRTSNDNLLRELIYDWRCKRLEYVCERIAELRRYRLWRDDCEDSDRERYQRFLQERNDLQELLLSHQQEMDLDA